MDEPSGYQCIFPTLRQQGLATNTIIDRAIHYHLHIDITDQIVLAYRLGLVDIRKGSRIDPDRSY